MKEVVRHRGDHLSAVARGAQRRLCRAARASINHEPELKGQIAQALLEMDHEPRA
jgi:hypothetical protein